jgi:NitT/TauT family transport system ATP-binding protein
MIKLENISYCYSARDGGLVEAVRDFSLTVAEGEFISLVGPSGCGKTTILEMIAGLNSPGSGRALRDDRPIGQSFGWAGYMTQNDTLLPWRTVAKNVAIGLELRSFSEETISQRVTELIGKVGLSGFADKYPSEISGGMKKRVGLIRILAYGPEVLLLDEPFGALDAQTKEFLQEDLLRLWSDYRKTVIFVTHDLAEAILLSDRIVLLSNRPAITRKEYQVTLPRPRLNRDIQFSDEFRRLHKEIRHDLMQEVTRFTASLQEAS